MSRTNQRTDEYGGSLENRLRFSTEIVSEIRKRVGESFPIIYRFSMWKLDDVEHAYQDQEELKRIITALSEAGTDLFHVSTHDGLSEAFESGKTLARLTKEFSSKPVIAVGKISDSKPARQLLENGDADLIAVGKALIANPDWAEKVRQGREKELKPFDPAQLAELY